LGRPEHGTDRGELGSTIVRGIDPGNPEVEQFDEVSVAVPVHQHDVFRLEIAVDDSFFVSRANSRDHAAHDAERPRCRHGAVVQLIA
jgi:hypothetical protein